MGYEHAALGLYPKANKGDKTYYVRAMNHGFSVRKVDVKGKPILRTNQATGLPMTTGTGEPLFHEESVMFKLWQTRFSDLGYMCVYSVTKDTPKHIAQQIEEMAKSQNSVIMSEEKFIEFSNPALAEHMKETSSLEAAKRKLEKDVGDLKEAGTKINSLEEEIERLKKVATK